MREKQKERKKDRKKYIAKYKIFNVDVCGHRNLPIDCIKNYNKISKYTQHSKTKFRSVIHTHQEGETMRK